MKTFSILCNLLLLATICERTTTKVVDRKCFGEEDCLSLTVVKVLVFGVRTGGYPKCVYIYDPMKNGTNIEDLNNSIGTPGHENFSMGRIFNTNSDLVQVSTLW